MNEPAEEKKPTKIVDDNKINEPIEEREPRGVGLTILIIIYFLGIIQSYFINIRFLITGNGIEIGVPMSLSLLNIVTTTISIILLVGVWKRKRWGCFGFMTLTLLSILPSIMIVGFRWVSVISGIFMMLTLYVAYRAKQKYFE